MAAEHGGHGDSHGGGQGKGHGKDQGVDHSASYRIPPLTDVPIPDPENFVSDEIRKELKGVEGGPKTGAAVSFAPIEMETVLDFTGLRGSGSNIYYSFVFQLPKWSYVVKKVDEFIEVTPTWAEYYNLTIAQKQKLEASIKTGLASAAQSVADYELLRHDLRRYQEVMSYFKQATLSKDDHVLRTLFVDRVDAHTGEGFSMISMTKRWPTIITDFVRMKTEWTDTKEIKEKLDVTAAEASVLKTKNQLFKEWKEIFFPEIKDRVARLQVLVESRKRSVDEYRNWLKPYLARYLAIREKTEYKVSEFISDPLQTPGFGQSQAITGVRLWFWKPFSPHEKGKPEGITEKKNRHGFIIDPYDDYVKKWMKKIEARYGVHVTDKDVDKIIKKAMEKPMGTNPMMDKRVIYYIFYDAKVLLGLIRTPPPEGFETDNLMFFPIKAHVISQNVLLLHLIELWAREKYFERQINSLIGSREAEIDALERIEKEFQPEEKKGRFPPLFRRGDGHEERKESRAKPVLEKMFYTFVKRGPYETIFRERGSKMYARAIGGDWGKVTGFIMEKMQVR